MRLLNAFSPNMLTGFPVTVTFHPLTVEEARSHATRGLESCVGHADTAAVFGSVLVEHVPCVRETVVLLPGEFALLGQYRGPRLPEGATSLPEGASIQWLLVEVR